ncbi:cytochrome C oxidase subunit IV family protein [Cryomorphaceae bacterium]|nr:cytochrome C oxidase subunit IV family protein [Cryomorphaceae bacterium]
MSGISVKRIWFVFWLLLVVTTVEVALGIIKPDVMMVNVMGTSLLNLTFIILTLVKAYYIVMYFMHFKYERSGMRWAIALPALILIPYLVFILLVEGGYIYQVIS